MKPFFTPDFPALLGLGIAILFLVSLMIYTAVML